MNILKLGFSVLSLNLLIMLVAYETEARKMVEGNLQAKRLNFSNDQIDVTSYGNLENKDAQIDITSYGNLENKDDNKNFWIYNKHGENNHQEAKKEKTHIHSSSHIDPSLRVFFLVDDLKQGKQITVFFPRRDLSSSPSFLAREEADSSPFSLKQLPNLLQLFSFSRHSPQAKTIQDTLRVCEIPPIKGETKYCATSSEAMLDFVQKILGEKTQFKALSTIHFSNSTPHLQKYTILNAPQEIETPKMVACHTMPYPYAVFYCHYTISKNRVFKVLLEGENGDKVKAIAVCHLDTSNWNPSHVSFKVLGILPGTSPICHFFPSDNLLWVPKFATPQVI